MYKPNPVVNDGNLFLNAFTAAILGNMPDRDIIHNSTNVNPMYRGRGIIIKSFLVMIFSNVKRMSSMGLDPTSFCVVWDKRLNGKYFKSEIIDSLGDGKSYKGDRNYVTESDLENPDLTPKERLKIEADLIRTRERYAAKSFIEKELPKFGIPSYSVSGWEADDLDFVWAIETDKRGGSQIHYSGDSDWSFSLRERDTFWQVNRSKLYKKDVNDVRVKFKIPDHLSLTEWAELNYSAFGSHNFLQRTFDPEIKRVTKKYKDKLFSGDLSDIVDTKRFEVQRKCFNILGLRDADKVIDLYDSVISHKTTASPADFRALLIDLSINDRDRNSIYNNYNDFLNILLNSKLKQF